MFVKKTYDEHIEELQKKKLSEVSYAMKDHDPNKQKLIDEPNLDEEGYDILLEANDGKADEADDDENRRDGD